MANLPCLNVAIFLVAGAGCFELLHVDIVLPDQLPECAPLFLRSLRRTGDVALVD